MLRKFKKILSRVVPALLLCCMFMMLFSPAVSAEGVDYKDYISNIEVDGHNDIVTITIPASEQYWVITDYTIGTTNTYPQGWLDFPPVAGTKYTIQLHVFDGYLNLDDIPDSTIFTAGFTFGFSDTVSYNSTYVSCNEQYYSTSGSWLGQIQTGVGFETFVGSNVYSITSKFNKSGPYSNGVTGNAGAVDLFLQLYQFTPTESTNYVHFEARDFTMTFSISSLYELQQTQEKTNQLLEAVEDNLEANGQKLDDILSSQYEMNDKMDNIINGEVEPELPNGSDTVTDLEDAEGALRDDAQAGLDEGTQIQQNALDILGQYVTGFAVFSDMFGQFSSIPFVSGLLSVSLSLGLVSAIMNIGFSAASSARKSSGKGKSKGG